jgi:hypothetical protein
MAGRNGWYQVWVVNEVDLGTTITNSSGSYVWNGDLLYSLMENLEGLFDNVCGHPSCIYNASTVDVNILNMQLPPSADDLVLRFTRSQDSIVGSNQGVTFSPNGPDTGATLTVAGSSAISEVFLDPVAGDPDPAALLANLAFHEAMHNKLETGQGAPFAENEIHTTDGTGLAVASGISSSTQLSDRNRRNMALYLGRVIPQFTGLIIP